MTLQEWIKKSGLKKTAFAQQVGISYKTLWDICNNHKRPRWETAEKLERFTGGQVQAVDIMRSTR